MRPPINYSGRSIGNFIVLNRAKTKRGNRIPAYWNCVCECGQKMIGRSKEIGAIVKYGLGPYLRCTGIPHGFPRSARVTLLNHAYSRAREKRLPCDIGIEDIVIPNICPLLDVPLYVGIGKQTNNSPSLDRIIPALGYIKGNVQVISYRANAIKHSASLQELETLVSNLRRQRKM